MKHSHILIRSEYLTKVETDINVGKDVPVENIPAEGIPIEDMMSTLPYYPKSFVVVTQFSTVWKYDTMDMMEHT